MSGTQVTARDIATGESETTEIVDNYVLIADGRAHISSIVAYANGTQVVTVKKAATAEEARAFQPTVTRHFGEAALR